MNNQPHHENPRRLPAKYSCGAVAADTPKDFIAELALACPAMKDYLERLRVADEVLRIRNFDMARRYESGLENEWLRLWLS